VSVMRIAFGVSAAYGLLVACGGPRSAAVSPTPDGSTDPPGAKPVPSQPVARRIEVQATSGTRHMLDVQVDATVSPESTPTDVQVVSETKGALIIVDTYASIKGGLSYCQAGEERFLRVVSLAQPTPEETLRVKLASLARHAACAKPVSSSGRWEERRRARHRVAARAGPNQPPSPGEVASN
jgi:hypothetical protein